MSFRFYNKKYKNYLQLRIKGEGVISENQGHVYSLLFYLKSYTWLFSTKDIKCSLNPPSVSLMRIYPGWRIHSRLSITHIIWLLEYNKLTFWKFRGTEDKKWQEKFWCFTFLTFFSHGLVLRSSNISSTFYPILIITLRLMIP